MARRMILMLTVMAALLAALGIVKFRQIQAAVAQGAFTPPPEAVTTAVARQEPWPDTVHGIGTVVAVRGVSVSADLPGIVHSIGFDSGQKVGQGDVLVQLDARQERAQLAAAEAQRDLARVSLERMRGLSQEGITSQADFDRAAAEAKQADARVGEIRATIDRKTIRAPFGGVLGIRQVNLGQYVNAGDAIAPLQALDPIYVQFDLPQQEMARLRVGALVRAAAADASATTGRITAIDTVIDPATRNVTVQATFDNPDRSLRPGMFVDTQVVLGTSKGVVALPSSAISYAPYGDSVYIVEELKDPSGKAYRGVRQQLVKLGGSRGDQVAVLTGVRSGDEVVTSGVFKLHSGAAVQVNNEMKPSNDPAPRPEDS